jgi:hypothetical protein
MSEYEKCIITSLIKEIPHYTGKSIVAHTGELNADCSLGYHCISKPISFDEPHSHRFHEILCFIGGDPTDISEFGADIEVTLGDKKYPINQPSVISIPAGVRHCPVNIKKVEKPIVFLEISLARIWKRSRCSKKQKR